MNQLINKLLISAAVVAMTSLIPSESFASNSGDRDPSERSSRTPGTLPRVGSGDVIALDSADEGGDSAPSVPAPVVHRGRISGLTYSGPRTFCGYSLTHAVPVAPAAEVAETVNVGIVSGCIHAPGSLLSPFTVSRPANAPGGSPALEVATAAVTTLVPVARGAGTFLAEYVAPVAVQTLTAAGAAASAVTTSVGSTKTAQAIAALGGAAQGDFQDTAASVRSGLAGVATSAGQAVATTVRSVAGSMATAANSIDAYVTPASTPTSGAREG